MKSVGRARPVPDTHHPTGKPSGNAAAPAVFPRQQPLQSQYMLQSLLRIRQPAADESPALHWGRIQAQGAGYEDSEMWSQPNPLSSTDGITMLDQLVARMPQHVYQARRTAVQKAWTWISRVAQAGGADAPASKTFLEPGSRDERIDVEIIAGSAFVP